MYNYKLRPIKMMNTSKKKKKEERTWCLQRASKMGWQRGGCKGWRCPKTDRQTGTPDSGPKISDHLKRNSTNAECQHFQIKVVLLVRVNTA